MPKKTEPKDQSPDTTERAEVVETIDVEKDLMDFPVNNIKNDKNVTRSRMSGEEHARVIKRVAGLYGIHDKTALSGIAELIRQGGANNGTPQSYSIEIKCPQEDSVAEISKREVSTVCNLVREGMSIKDLAEYMALDIVKVGLARIRAAPDMDQSGDLARKINNRLTYKGQPNLTPEECVGCASYAQRIPNLNELTGSDRLVTLLREDLAIRINERNKRSANPSNKKTFNKGKLTTAQKEKQKKEEKKTGR